VRVVLEPVLEDVGDVQHRLEGQQEQVADLGVGQAVEQALGQVDRDAGRRQRRVDVGRLRSVEQVNLELTSFVGGEPEEGESEVAPVTGGSAAQQGVEAPKSAHTLSGACHVE
jgi:hypothetical protein